MEQAITIVGEEKTRGVQILAWKSALKLECKGMKMSRGVSVYQIVKNHFGWKGSKEKVYRQLQQYVWDNMLKLNDCAVLDENEGWLYVKRGVPGYWPWASLDTELTPEEYNKAVGATDKEQREDMKIQSMFRWRVGA